MPGSSALTASAPSVRSATPHDRATCSVLTVQTTLSTDSDAGADGVVAWLQQGGHRVLSRGLVAADVELVRRRVLEIVESGMVDVCLVTGGAGIGLKDVTTRAVESLFEKQLAGFGEFLRQIASQHLGPLAILSQVTAGIAGRTAIFTLPAAAVVCQAAMEQLIGPILPHLVDQLAVGSAASAMAT